MDTGIPSWYNLRMSDTQTYPRPALWLPALVVGAYWLACARLLSPQWSFYAQYNYGWAVPFLCGYLFWQRWITRPVPDASPKATGIFLLLLCALPLLPTRVIVEANPIWRVGSWVMGLELVGLTTALLYLAGGKNWLKHFWFPVAFYLVAIPWPSQWEDFVVQFLARGNTQVAVEALTVLGIPALPHGNVIEISTGMVGIDEACSGIRSLQATLMMALFFGETNRLNFVRRALLLAAGVGLALFCNVVRTLLLVWIASRSGLEAMEKWHDPTGIVILLACFTTLWLVAARLNPAKNAKAEIGSKIPWPELKPRWMPAALLGWLVVVEAGNALWFGVREQADAARLNWNVRWPTDHAQFREVELSRRVILEMRFKEGRSATWTEGEGVAWQLFYFRWGPAAGLVERVSVQCAKTHRPEVCLPAAGLELREQRGVKDFTVDGLTLPFRAYTFTHRGAPLFVYFCAWEDGTRGLAANMRENTASRLAAALAGSRSLSQRVVEIAVSGIPDAEKADAALAAQLTQIITRESQPSPK